MKPEQMSTEASHFHSETFQETLVCSVIATRFVLQGHT